MGHIMRAKGILTTIVESKRGRKIMKTVDHTKSGCDINKTEETTVVCGTLTFAKIFRGIYCF